MIVSLNVPGKIQMITSNDKELSNMISLDVQHPYICAPYI